MSTDPITDAEVAGVPHCPSCGQPSTAEHTAGCVYLITDPDPYYEDGTEAFADGQDHLAEQTDNSGEALAETDDTPQGAYAVTDDDLDQDDWLQENDSNGE